MKMKMRYFSNVNEPIVDGFDMKQDEDDDEDEDDEDDDDEEDEEAYLAVRNGDEEYYVNRIVPLAKRRRIDETSATKGDSKEEKYWVCFDNQVVEKTLIEMLNMSLTKLAHGSVMILNSSSKVINRDAAVKALQSIITDKKAEASTEAAATATPSSTDNEDSKHPGYWVRELSVFGSKD